MTKATRSFCHREEKSVIKFFSGTSQLSSGDASDSICPKGWGMAGLEGDGSYHRFIKSVYGMNKTNTALTQNYKEYNEYPHQNKLQTFVLSGNYYVWQTTNHIADREQYGRYWTTRQHFTNSAYHLSFSSYIFSTNSDSRKGYGYSVRCIAKSHFSLDFYAYL